MTAAAVVGLSAGKRILRSSFYYSDFAEKLTSIAEHRHIIPTKTLIVAKKIASHNHRGIDAASIIPPTSEQWIPISSPLEEKTLDPETPLEALLLLQKSMLEKQLELSFERTSFTDLPKEKLHITSSGIPARVRRIKARKRTQGKMLSTEESEGKKSSLSTVSPELLQNRLIGYVRGLTNNELLTHAQVVNLSRKIKAGISLEEHKSR